MRQTLRLHPDSSSFAVTHIEVEIIRPQTRSLTLAYVVTGRIGDVALPAVAAAARRDELWRHTCFEAFVGAGVGYYEFTLNDSPVASKGTVWVQLVNQEFIPLSQKIYFDTFDACDKNLIIINYKQVR